jgi:hypothetical protein
MTFYAVDARAASSEKLMLEHLEGLAVAAVKNPQSGSPVV